MPSRAIFCIFQAYRGFDGTFVMMPFYNTPDLPALGETLGQEVKALREMLGQAENDASG